MTLGCKMVLVWVKIRNGKMKVDKMRITGILVPYLAARLGAVFLFEIFSITI